MKEYNKPTRSLRPGLYADDPLATVRIPQRSLSSQSLKQVLTTQPDRTTKRQNTHQQKQTLGYIKGALINHSTMCTIISYGMLRYDDWFSRLIFLARFNRLHKMSVT